MFFEFNFQDDKEDPYMSTTSISDLSTEILVIVLSFLPIEDLSRYINLHTSVLSSFSQTSIHLTSIIFNTFMIIYAHEKLVLINFIL